MISAAFVHEVEGPLRKAADAVLHDDQRHAFLRPSIRGDHEDRLRGKRAQGQR